MTVDFYSDTHGNWQSDASYPMGAGNAGLSYQRHADLHLRQEADMGLQLDRNRVPGGRGASYPSTPFTFSGTTAQFLAGKNTSTAMDYISRPLVHAVDLGWDAPPAHSSAILSLWGTADIGQQQRRHHRLSMSLTATASVMPRWSVATSRGRSGTARAT